MQTEMADGNGRNETATRACDDGRELAASSGPERIARFVEYAMAFEQVLGSDDWDSLEQFFTPDAEREVVCGGPLAIHSIGRDAVIADLRRNVADLDRRFDRRLPEIIAGPIERDGKVWMDWRLTLQREGLPDLVLEGIHGTTHQGDRISRIDEAVSTAMSERVEAYLATHAERLLPAAPTPPTSSRDSKLTRARMRELVEGYARAKSRADVAGALAFCHPSFGIDTVSFGISSRDRDETAAHLHAFFTAFPDYGVSVSDMTFGEGSVACWGTARMTMRGDSFGLAATGKRAEVQFFCSFTFTDGLLASERFFFDLATLCDGIGVPLATMRQTLDHLRAAQDGVVRGG